MDDLEATGQASEATASEGVGDSAAESPEAPQEFSIADAFAAAKAEAEAAATPSEDSTESSQPEGEAQPQADEARQPEASSKPATAQGVLDRINTLVAQGRESELTPEERGVYNRLRETTKAQIEKATAEEREFRQTYLDFLRLREEDPEAFAEKVVEDPAIAEFMRSYRAANPNVSLDNPDAGPRQPTPDEVRLEVRQQYNDAITDVVKAVAAEAGVSFDEAVKGAEGKLGTVLTRVVDAAVKAGIEKALPEIQKREREAAELQAQALYANKTIVTPKVMGAGVSDPAAVRPSDGTKDRSYSMRQAAEDAKRELAATR